MRKFLLAFTSLTLLAITPALADKAEQDENQRKHAASELAESGLTGRALDRMMGIFGVGRRDYERALQDARRSGNRRLSSGMNRSFDTNANRSMQMRDARSGNTSGMTGGDSYAFAPMPPQPKWEQPAVGYRFDRLYPDTPRWNF